MTQTRTRLFVVLLSALSVAGTMSVRVGHHHCSDGCTRQSSAGLCHHGHDENESCSGTHWDSEQPPYRSPAPMDDEDQCLVCRYLAERPLPVVLVELPHISEPVELFDSALPAVDVASPPKSHHSRAPPV